MPTSPPSAELRTASIPQVGASTQAIGSIQPGSSESGMSMPVIVQIGYSSACESALAAR